MFTFDGTSLSNLTTKGAFLVSGEKPNLMTISWGGTGVLWNQKVMFVPVRESRYTKVFIDESGYFSVCVPSNSYKEELAFCGKVSGRDFNKIKEKNIPMNKCKLIPTYYVDGCSYVAECKVVYKLPMTLDNLPSEIMNFYKTNDAHNLYIAIIQNEIFGV